MKIKVKKLHQDVHLPTYATDGSGCFDIYNADFSDVVNVATGVRDGGFMGENKTKVFKTNLAFEIPEGYVMLVFGRSGHAFKSDISLSNCVGVIDSDYRGELLIKLRCDGHEGRNIHAYERIAQGLVVPIPKVEFIVADELSETVRADGGFGSTGT